MSDAFDPYQQWLGISPRERPADHYRLLGLSIFESNPATIVEAADERMKLVRSYQTGPRGSHTQKLLNEISTARLCLLNPDTKQMYDTVLHGRFAAAASAGGPPNGSPASLQLPTASKGAPVAMLPSAAAPMARRVPVPNGGVGPVAAGIANAASNPMSPVAMAVSAPPRAFLARPASAVPVPPPFVQEAYRNHETAPAALSDQTFSDSPTPSRFTAIRLLLLVVVVAAVAVPLSIFAPRWMRKDSVEAPAVTPVADTAAEGDGEPAADPDTDTPKTPAEPEPVTIGQEGSGQINFPASLAEIHGFTARLDIREDENVIGQWTSPEDWLSWHFKVTKPGIFRVYVQYAAAMDADGGEFELSVDDDARAGDVRASAGQELNTETLFVAIKRSGEHTLNFKVKSKPGAEFMTLKGIRLEPK